MNIKFLCILPAILFSSTLISQQENNKPENNFKIIGYYFLNAALNITVYADSNYLFLDKITHLNIAFINHNPKGFFKQNHSN